jgi:hypothetical protein
MVRGEERLSIGGRSSIGDTSQCPERVLREAPRDGFEDGVPSLSRQYVCIFFKFMVILHSESLLRRIVRDSERSVRDGSMRKISSR